MARHYGPVPSLVVTDGPQCTQAHERRAEQPLEYPLSTLEYSRRAEQPLEYPLSTLEYSRRA